MVRNLKKRLKDQRGLTLVELLAVIVILGIVAAIAVPSIGGIINKTKDDAKVAEGIQIISAAKMYVSAHKVPSDKTLESAELDQYLDSVDDKGYVVTVGEETGGKYTYSLTKHGSVALVDGKDNTKTDSAATEAELLAY